MRFAAPARWLFVALLVLLWPLPVSHAQNEAPSPPLCWNKAWRPEGVGLKDHALFRFDGYYYLIAIPLPKSVEAPPEQTFAYARTKDFCTWENLGTVLRVGAPGSPDETQIWAPHVLSFGTTWYMFYTGVNRNVAQTIMLATTTNPADPKSWKKRGVVFYPTHAGAVYPGPRSWSDARDPMVLYDWVGRRYVMYYTGRDSVNCPNGQDSCGIVGAATARQLDGPWQDQGAVLRLDTPGMPESPYVVAPGIGGVYYLFYNHSTSGINDPLASGGQQVVASTTPLGPWGLPERFLPGWASDFHQSSEGWMMSYLKGYAVGVTKLSWNQDYTPARPMSIYERRYQLPVIMGSMPSSTTR
jgi:hypothetical protein